MRKTELWVTIVGVIGSLLVAVLETGLLVEGSIAYVVLGALATVISYVTGRSYVKGQEAKAKAIVSANEKYSIVTRLNLPPTDE